jgi:hypothetical protein
MSDRGYTNLLVHLHRPTTTLPLPAIQAVLAHHLAHLFPPTPLAATAVSSPLFLSQPLTHSKLQALSNAFRHSTHIKFRAITSPPSSRLRALFVRSLGPRVRQWVGAVMGGVQGGQPVMRLACCSGLLMGLEDLRVAEKLEVGGRGGVEEEVVVALAEVMDTYAYSYGYGRPSHGVEEWEEEFQPMKEGEGEFQVLLLLVELLKYVNVRGVDTLSLALILASQSLPLIAPDKLKALPLRVRSCLNICIYSLTYIRTPVRHTKVLARLLTSVISSAFQSGTFLSTLSSSISPSPSHKIKIPVCPPRIPILRG